MTVAQGIVKVLSVAKQVALGTPLVGAGGQQLRRVTSGFMLERDTYENPEITTHQQSTGVSYGLKKTTGKIKALLSPSTYKLFMAAALRKDFVAGVSAATLSLTIAGAAGARTITRGAGSWLTDGFKTGDVIRLSVGALNAANIAKNLLVTAVTSATVLTVVPLNGVDMVAEGPIATCTATVFGKKTLAPLTAHTNDYFSVEEWYPDVARSETFNDTKVDKIDIKLPATGNCELDMDFLGLSRVKGTAQVLTAPTSVTTTGVCTAVNGVVYINGAVIGTCTGAQLTLDPSMSMADAVIASNSGVDVNRGIIKVSGNFTGLFDGNTVSAFYDAETPVSLILAVAVDQTATSDFVTFVLGRIKITGDAPDDGQKVIVRTYPFTAEININGGAALAFDQTIMTIQDSAA